MIEPSPLRVPPGWWYDVDAVVHDGDEHTESVLTRPEDLEEIRRVLASAFDVPRFETLDYLRWFYTQCPFGETFSGIAGRSATWPVRPGGCEPWTAPSTCG